MSSPILIRRRAEHDLAEIALYYENQATGTGLHFLRCVDAAMALLARHPEAGPHQFGPFRRILVSRYPYGIFYSVREGGMVVVHSVFASARDPGVLRRLLQHEDDNPA